MGEFRENTTGGKSFVSTIAETDAFVNLFVGVFGFFVKSLMALLVRREGIEVFH